MARRRTGVQRAQAMSQPNLDRVQERRVRQVRSSPYNQSRVSKTEQRRRASDPSRASKQATTHRDARMKQGRQYMKDAKRAMDKDLQVRRTASAAGRATARRGAQLASRAAGPAGLVATVADMVGRAIGSRADAQAQARQRYNKAMGFNETRTRNELSRRSSNRGLRIQRRNERRGR